MLESILDCCVLCNKDTKGNNHLIVRCEVAHFLWYQFLERSVLHWSSPQSMAKVYFDNDDVDDDLQARTSYEKC